MVTYRNIELSSPRFERDELRFLTFGSPALNGERGEVTLFVPEETENRSDVPLVVLLHGVFGSHWSWAFNGGAHAVTRNLLDCGEIPPVVLAMPSDGLHQQGSGYLPLRAGDFERWIVEDVVGCVTEMVPCLGAASKRYLAGFSMGGYGALRLGAKYADRFNGISGHSSITDYDQLGLFVEHLPDPAPGQTREELSVAHWMIRNRSGLPPVRFDCGVDDLLIQHNRALHEQLEAKGIPHVYEEFEGRHSWAYWEDHLKDTLRFLLVGS